MPQRTLTLADVCEVLNISSSQAYALVRSGDLRAFQLGGRNIWRVEAAELEAYIQRMYDETRDRLEREREHPHHDLPQVAQSGTDDDRPSTTARTTAGPDGRHRVLRHAGEASTPVTQLQGVQRHRPSPPGRPPGVRRDLGEVEVVGPDRVDPAHQLRPGHPQPDHRAVLGDHPQRLAQPEP